MINVRVSLVGTLPTEKYLPRPHVRSGSSHALHGIVGDETLLVPGNHRQPYTPTDPKPGIGVDASSPIEYRVMSG